MFGIDYSRQMDGDSPPKEASFNKERGRFGVLEYMEEKKDPCFMKKQIPSWAEIEPDVPVIGKNDVLNSPEF